MQTEMLLDLVKPIRNDLSEAMTEREPVAMAMATATVPTAMPMSMPMPTPTPRPEAAVAAVAVGPASRASVWGRLKRRVVGAVFRTEKL